MIDNNNCTNVAIEAWNSIIDDVQFESDVMPFSLKNEIDKQQGSYEVHLLEILEVMQWD